MKHAARVSLTAGLAAALLVSCGPEDPYSAERSDPTPAADGGGASARAGRVVAAPESGELPGRAPRVLLDEPDRFPDAGRTPYATVKLAARLYGNWTAATAAHQMDRMAALSVGQARAELRQAAAQSTVDRQQRGARSSATLEAASVQGHGARRRVIVVTRERLAAPDLPAEGWRYRVTVARLERRAHRWVIAQWLPQP